MAFQELINYIVQQLKAKLELADIKRALLEAGWDEKSVDGAYQEALGALSLSAQGENEHVFEQFSPLTSRGRMVKRAVILGLGIGLVTLALYVVTR